MSIVTHAARDNEHSAHDSLRGGYLITIGNLGTSWRPDGVGPASFPHAKTTYAAREGGSVSTFAPTRPRQRFSKQVPFSTLYPAMIAFTFALLATTISVASKTSAADTPDLTLPPGAVVRFSTRFAWADH
ncbi:hypothetical protein JVT61DRAFT_7123 [Boletus reticuloceps]|uniref:Uncharacterized protein n=1 Tax=Boletus reticuloceps TaxID=495285 RepID=A0A8I2YJS5_9AGAM|nr:hypothetical protein JVT61DRAFT_7123 [Boletus reticuloceps]